MKEKLDAKLNMAAQYRGRILNKMADIEFTIEIIIAYYYCGDNADKADEIRHSILGHKFLSFEIKQTALGFIIQNHYKDFDKKYPSINSDLDDYKDLRNAIAHYKVLNREDELANFDGDNVAFETFSTKRQDMKIKGVTLNRLKVNQLEVRMGNTNRALIELLTLINSEVGSRITPL